MWIETRLGQRPSFPFKHYVQSSAETSHVSPWDRSRSVVSSCDLPRKRRQLASRCILRKRCTGEGKDVDSLSAAATYAYRFGLSVFDHTLAHSDSSSGPVHSVEVPEPAASAWQASLCGDIRLAEWCATLLDMFHYTVSLSVA